MSNCEDPNKLGGCLVVVCFVVTLIVCIDTWIQAGPIPAIVVGIGCILAFIFVLALGQALNEL